MATSRPPARRSIRPAPPRALNPLLHERDRAQGTTAARGSSESETRDPASRGHTSCTWPRSRTRRPENSRVCDGTTSPRERSEGGLIQPPLSRATSSGLTRAPGPKGDAPRNRPSQGKPLRDTARPCPQGHTSKPPISGETPPGTARPCPSPQPPRHGRSRPRHTSGAEEIAWNRRQFRNFFDARRRSSRPTPPVPSRARRVERTPNAIRQINQLPLHSPPLALNTQRLDGAGRERLAAHATCANSGPMHPGA